MRLSLRGVGCLALAVLCGCGKRWNPDEQMARQVLIIEQERIRAAALAESQAVENVRRIKSDAIIKARPNISERQLAEVVGYKYESLARTERDGSVWEHRRYRLGDVVESMIGAYSREYEICDKERVLFEVLVGGGVVREVDY